MLQYHATSKALVMLYREYYSAVLYYEYCTDTMQIPYYEYYTDTFHYQYTSSSPARNSNAHCSPSTHPSMPRLAEQRRSQSQPQIGCARRTVAVQGPLFLGARSELGTNFWQILKGPFFRCIETDVHFFKIFGSQIDVKKATRKFS